jgi:hypothetical protein
MQTAGNARLARNGTTTDEMPAGLPGAPRARRVTAPFSSLISHHTAFIVAPLHLRLLAPRLSMAASSAPNPKDVKLAAMRRGRLDDPEDEPDPKDVAKFGTVLGLAAGGVRCLACKSSPKSASNSVSGYFYMLPAFV